MEEKIINVEGNVGMSCQNPSERLYIHCNTTDADHKHPFGFTVDGNIGIGTPYQPTELHINKK
jgi:hypothetical protein